ncbi:YhfT family protein [Enterococcus sp. DIV1420a]|uniref:YhfT family protein n=1 Tax=Enterococcus sp. DIV1420a TaxID=2774672 RepID=UPI003F28E4E0
MDYIKFLDYIVMACIGGLGSILANKGIAVFNDGLRPVMPEYFEGKIGRKELAATSFALSFGLVIGFGIPISIGTTIIVAHSILLACDIIGIWAPDNKIGMILAGVVGALYSIGIMIGLQFIVDLFALLPINFLAALGYISGPVFVAFAVFPCIAVAYQHGFKKGIYAFGITLLSYLLIAKFGKIQINNNTAINLSPEGMSLLVSMIIMIVFAMKQKGTNTGSNAALLSIFSERVMRIKKNWIWLALMGGLICSASSLLILAVDILPQQLLVQNKINEAAIATIARAIGFIPLVFSTAIVTGVYGMAGTTMIFGIGLVMQGHPFLAFLAGFIWMFLEVMLVSSVTKSLDKFPGIRDMGEHIRNSMTKVIEMALLIGSAIAANQINDKIGFLWVIGFFLLNKSSKKPIVELAVGPISVICLGILVNVLKLIHLI